jgi:hypothetical protein
LSRGDYKVSTEDIDKRDSSPIFKVLREHFKIYGKKAKEEGK